MLHTVSLFTAQSARSPHSPSILLTVSLFSTPSARSPHGLPMLTVADNGRRVSHGIDISGARLHVVQRQRRTARSLTNLFAATDLDSHPAAIGEKVQVRRGPQHHSVGEDRGRGHDSTVELVDGKFLEFGRGSDHLGLTLL